MRSNSNQRYCITGLGICSGLGQGKEDFFSNLLAGRHAFTHMQRPGRQLPGTKAEKGFIGSEIESLRIPASISADTIRTASFTAQIALATLEEAWHEAQLFDITPERIGLIVAGSNVQQRELTLVHDKYNQRLNFLRPSYGLTFFDSDVCGLCTQYFGIKGIAYTLGGASASGQLAVLNALDLLNAERVDVCIVVGALMDLSYWECQGFRSLGAMGSDRFANNPELACRPFDKEADGFIFGESCGVLVIERQQNNGVLRNKVQSYAYIDGAAVVMDANRNPNPSLEGEIEVIRNALGMANANTDEVEYINPHGTGSVLGDQIEAEAIRETGLAQAYINTTKSLIGHGLSAAGTVEIVATVLQMKYGVLHPSRNLYSPIADLNWVGERSVTHNVNCALTTSLGFGGVNTALYLRKY